MKKVYQSLYILVILGLLVAACAQQTPIPTEEAPAVQASPTSAPQAATDAPAAATPTTETVETPTGRFNEAPMLAELVAAGSLPPVEERLPIEPLVVEPLNGVGTYGGELNTRVSGPGDWGDVWHATFPHLLWFDENVQEVIPDLAKGYEYNDDMTVLTIYLREGLKWSDGDPFDAEDLVSWWVDFRMHPEFNPDLVPPGEWAPGGEPMEVVKIDDYTVEYHFAAPYPMALNVITSWNGMPGRFFLPSHKIQELHADYNPDAATAAAALGYDTWQEAVNGFANLMWPGSDPKGLLPTLGMWRQASVTSTEVVFERNPYYWAVDTEGNQLPYIDRVRAEIVPDPEVYVVNIIQGKYDFGKAAADKIELLKANEANGNYGIRLYSGDVVSQPAYAFNQNHRDAALREIFQDVRFRQAMSVAINRDEINDLVFDGYGTPTQATVNRAASFYDPAWGEAFAQYDPDLANQLLDEMGLNQRNNDGWRLRPDGRVLEFIINANDPATELVRDYWREVGVKAELNAIDVNLYWTRGEGGELDLGTWGVDNSVEIKVFQSVSKFWMGTGDLAYAIDWVRWHDTRGAEGVEPPDRVKEYFANWDAIQLASGAEYERLAKEIFDFYAEEVYIIGTVGYGLNAVFVSQNLNNVPEQLLFMDPTNWWLMARPDQWYLSN
jgi:peptide/nickel transport system substrate-binding protein